MADETVNAGERVKGGHGARAPPAAPIEDAADTPADGAAWFTSQDQAAAEAEAAKAAQEERERQMREREKLSTAEGVVKK
eukprot:gene5183-19754_t